MMKASLRLLVECTSMRLTIRIEDTPYHACGLIADGIIE